jgi:hypothetical protein
VSPHPLRSGTHHHFFPEDALTTSSRVFMHSTDGFLEIPFNLGVLR